MMRLLTTISVLSALWLTSCLPMTFSHEGVIDFTQYQSVYVQPVELTGSAVFSDIDTATQSYLIDVLREDAGFRTVTGDSTASTDAVLVVQLRVDQEIEIREGQDLRRYLSRAEFTLRTASGSAIISGDVSDENDEIRESQEDALDEVAHFFLAPYRL
jgi:hypothetical protein